MFQSPRGSKEIVAQNSFETQNPDSKDNTDSSRPIHNNSQLSTTEMDNQLVWSTPIRQTLHPQILRQLAYSNTLCHYYY